MPTKTESLRGFLKGLISVTNRFSTPKGAVIQLSNLLLNERGALQTIDGTTIESVLPGGNVNPILCLQLYVNPNDYTTKLLGLVRASSTTVNMYNFSTNPATGPVVLTLSGGGTTTTLNIQALWDHPQMFNFAGVMVITLGNGNTTQFYSEPGGVPTITPIGTTSFWQPNRQYQVGDIVVPNPDNGYCYQALNLLTLGGGLSGPGAGQSGAVPPTWPFPSGTTFDSIHPAVSDNTVLWRLVDKSNFAAGIVPPGGAHGISHEGAMWLFGTSPNDAANGADGPMTLRQSHLNVTNEWPGIFSAYIGKDDGQKATGIGSFTIAEAGIAPTGGLVCFKDYSTYNVTASFASESHSLQPVKTDLGCIAPRSVQFVPAMGLARLTHMGVAVYNGVEDQLISEEIRPYVLGGFGISGVDPNNADNSRSALISNPPLYVLAIPTVGHTWCNRILCYDIINKAWTVTDLPFEISAFVQIRVPTDTSFFTHFPKTYMCGAADGTIRSWQNGADPFWDQDQTQPIRWSLTTPEVGTEADGRLFFRRTMMRMHAPSAVPITFTPIYGSRSGPTQTKAAQSVGPIGFAANQGGNQYQQTFQTYENDFDLIVRFSQGVTGVTERIALSGSGRVTIEAIELDVKSKTENSARAASLMPSQLDQILSGSYGLPYLDPTKIETRGMPEGPSLNQRMLQFLLSNAGEGKSFTEDRALDWISDVYHVPTSIAQKIMESYAFAQNESKATSGPYQAQLNPTLENQFEDWVRRGHMPFDPKSMTPDYDMRSWWSAMQARDPKATYKIGDDSRIYFPSAFVTPYSLGFNRDSKYWNSDRP